MAMDFFESQELAKRHTGRLVILFILAVLGTVAGTYLVVALTVGKGNFGNPALIAATVLGVLAVIGVGTAAKFAQMSGGGRAVAVAMGGRQVAPSSTETDERRILNIVEEMAIASGVPVPPVYVIEDDSINAFAAGISPQRAVIGLTRGCIRQLTRDELQGVVAHEFSHIFHLDTRLNMRLVAWLGGIFAISLIGRFLMRSGLNTRHVRSSSDKGSGIAAIMLVGLGLFLVGIIGYFFGRLIQAAVCRQREYLADASAVQYTRNAEGIAGALEKIGRMGSALSAPAATEFSHFFLAEGVPSLLATHPPLAERIRRIRGVVLRPEQGGSAAALPTAPALPPLQSSRGGAGQRASELPIARPRLPTPVDLPTAFAAAANAIPPVDARIAQSALQEARSEIGRLSPAQMQFAASLMLEMPPAMTEASRNPFAARAVVCALLLATDPRERARQLDAIALTDPKLRAAVEGLLPALADMRSAQRLPLLEMCAAALTLLSPAQYAQFRTTLSQLIAVDGQVDRVEWTVRVVLRRVVEGRGAAGSQRPRDATLEDMARVVSVLAWTGARSAADVEDAWECARLDAAWLPAKPMPAAACTLDALDDALRAMEGNAIKAKRTLVNACVACVGADAVTTVEEAELLRAICDSIGVPMPPVRPVQ